LSGTPARLRPWQAYNEYYVCMGAARAFCNAALYLVDESAKRSMSPTRAMAAIVAKVGLICPASFLAM
jgi:uncharacterized membrane protein YhiD involved in acid resistance